ncbi:PLP-dependent aminotransferase family protein [Paenibacillus caui]|uniref:PLP-dependent aminotransferase family protein n=1 Tax=Paenibacillus caui TaxID=2873927 RepID=UPI001CA9E17C|nr:PLP-dependent aminotransferase family protein [Paenibacillus caui]
MRQVDGGEAGRWMERIGSDGGRAPENERLISLAEERPDPELVPWDALREASAAAWSSSSDLRGSDDPAGSLNLRSWLADAISEAGGTRAGAEELLLAASGLSALDLVLRCKVKPGAAVLVEAPAAPETLRLLRLHGAAAVQVAGDRDGMLPDALAAACGRHAPPLAIVSPAPQLGGIAGGGWSLERREALLEAAQRNGMTVVEDNGHGIAWRAEEGTPSLFALQRQRAGGAGESGVIQIGSLEPHLPPLGWLRAGSACRGALAAAKAALTPPGAALWGERVLEHLLTGSAGAGRFSPAAYEAAMRREYGERRELVLSLLREPSWQGTAPLEGGGRHIWARLPEGCSSDKLLRASLREGAAFLPGPLTYAEAPPEADRLIRLSFTGCGRVQLKQALARIAGELEAFTARWDRQ